MEVVERLHLSATNRGFTAHTQADEVWLVHMNGRVYDQNLGRFLSVDPIVQDGGSQALNPYSYIQNNPLSGSDPSGYAAAKDECAGTKSGGCSSPDAVVKATRAGTLTGSHIKGASGGSSLEISLVNPTQGGMAELSVAMAGMNSGYVVQASVVEKAAGAIAADQGKSSDRKEVKQDRPSGDDSSSIPAAYGDDAKSNERYAPIPESERESFLADARAAVRRKFNSPGMFATDELKEKYIHLLGAAQIILAAVDMGNPAASFYYNGTSGTIKLYNESMVRRIFGDAGRHESRGGTVERIARIMTHELRHLTNANRSIPQSQAQSAAALMSPSAHDSAPREKDADRFERQVWDRQEGPINDF